MRTVWAAAARMSAVPYALIALASALWTCAAGRIDHRFLTFSDGVYTYIATRVADSGVGVLYDDIALSQPPTVVLIAAGVWKVFGSVEALRVLLAVLWTATAMLSFAVSRASNVSVPWSLAAAGLTLVAPIQAQFAGVDGEMLLAPAALVVTLTMLRGNWRAAGLITGLAFAIKLTWLPFALAAYVIALRTGSDSARTLTKWGIWGLAVATITMTAFGMDPISNIGSQSGSGLQPGLAFGMLFAVLVLWAPLIPPLAAGTAHIPMVVQVMVTAALLSFAFTLKSGTVFNILVPAEPLVAVVVAVGLATLFRQSGVSRAVAVLCVLGVAVHSATLLSPTFASAFPFPLGAAYAEPDSEQDVDRAVDAIHEHARSDDRVFVNPFLAVVAERRLLDDQADWFILDAGAPKTWKRLKARALDGEATVLGIDSNVNLFDDSLRTSVPKGRTRIFHVDRPPLKTSLYSRTARS